MAKGSLVRVGGICAVLGGIAWVFLSLESIARPDPEEYRTALFLIPWSLSAVGIVGMHVLQRDRVTRLGVVGFWLTIGGMAAGIVGTIANLADFEALTWLEIPVAPVVWTIGMVLFGLATARTGAVPAWAGVALILAEPMTVLIAVALSPWVPLQDEGSYSGTIGNGVAFLALGYAILYRSRVPVAEGEASLSSGLAPS